MTRRRLPSVFLIGACALAVVLVVAPPVLSDVLKNKNTGESIRGTLTEQQINKRHIFKSETGETLYLNLAEWEILEREKPASAPQPTSFDAVVEPVKVDVSTEPDEKVILGYVIPIHGPIIQPCILEGLAKALADAKKAGTAVVVFRINTPGGRVELADRIIRMIEGIDWATTVAWVQGPDKQALSAGAYISLAAHQIYMAPGSTMGAATPYTVDATGSAQVDEKMVSAFRARFRSLAQQRGHPAALADAMVDSSLSVVQVWLEERQMLVTRDEADRLERENAASGRFRRGKIISPEGKLVTLTSDEAFEFGVCRGIAQTLEEVGKAVGFDAARAGSAEWLAKWVEEEGKRRTDEVEKYRTLFNSHIEEAVRNDPRNQQYFVYKDMTFSDGGRRWREYTDKSLEHLKVCAKAIAELERMSQGEWYTFYVQQEMLNDMKAKMETMYKRLREERNARRAP